MRKNDDDYAGSGLDGPHAPSPGMVSGLLATVALLGAALVLVSVIVVRDYNARG